MTNHRRRWCALPCSNRMARPGRSVDASRPTPTGQTRAESSAVSRSGVRRKNRGPLHRRCRRHRVWRPCDGRAGAAPDTRITLRVDTATLHVVLGPAAFLAGSNVQLRNGDTLEVIGSRAQIADSPVILAREVRRGEQAWSFRDASGQPLWSSGQAPSKGFWTKKRVVFAFVGAKVLMVAVMLLT